jgi:hypothetical protein
LLPLMLAVILWRPRSSHPRGSGPAEVSDTQVTGVTSASDTSDDAPAAVR